MSTSPAAITVPTERGWQRFVQPRYLIAGLITVILVAGELQYHILPSPWWLCLSLGAALGMELLLSKLVRGRWVNVQSAYITGISAALLTKPAGGILWPVVAVAGLSIASKYVLTFKNRHLWNPTNFGVCLMVLAAPNSMTILSHEMSNDIGVNLIIWSLGLVIAWRSNVLHVTGTFVLAFLALTPLRAAVSGESFWTELGPITGPMYQLFIFFMITDPRTVVSKRSGRILVAVIVALVETGLRIACEFDLAWAKVFEPAPAMYALTIVGPTAMLIDLSRKPSAPAK